jgi:hypothetical protein
MTALPLGAYIEAEVHLASPEDGGRRSGIWSGYRCNCWIGRVDEDGGRAYNDATFYLVGAEEMAPGTTARARVLPHDPDSWSRLEVGGRFELCEGARVVGDAVVVTMFPTN